MKLEITWPILSAECLQFNSGVWIRVYQTSEGDDNWPEEATAITALSIPQKCCFVNKDAASYSIVLFPQQSSSADDKDPCFFSLARNLTQCRAYAVEVRREITIGKLASNGEKHLFKS
jgi:hypothetical protein